MQVASWVSHKDSNAILGTHGNRTSLPGMSTFITPSKPNFRITAVQDASSSTLHNPFGNGSSWDLLPHPPSHPPVASSQASATEKRASVIMKTSDVSKSVKTCWELPHCLKPGFTKGCTGWEHGAETSTLLFASYWCSHSWAGREIRIRIQG